MLKVVFNAFSMTAGQPICKPRGSYGFSMRRALAGGVLLLLTCACSRPFLARDGTLVFQEKGAHGASVVTANGLEFHDVTDVPKRVVVRDPYEPWRAPIGFLIPASGRFTKTSTPTLVATNGLAIVLRPSDTRVPSWGGEMLVRVDVLAPAAPGTARWGEDVAIVLDGRGPDTRALAEQAIVPAGRPRPGRRRRRRGGARRRARRCRRPTGRSCWPRWSTASRTPPEGRARPGARRGAPRSGALRGGRSAACWS